MNTRNLSIIFIVAALVAGGIWYVNQPAPAEPAKVTDAPQPAAPKPVVAPPIVAPQVVLPKAPPVVASTAPAPAEAQPASTEETSITELNSAMSEMEGLLQAGDFAGLIDRFMPPDMQAQMTPEMRAQMAQQMAQNPQAQQQLQMMADALHSLQGQTPTFNDAGDHATYQMTPPAGMVPPGANVPATIPVTFVKINGRWYTGNDNGL